jgi:GLPGLI family protein
MKLLFLLIYLAVINDANSQNTYRIDYDYKMMLPNINGQQLYNLYSTKLIYNDSASLFYYMGDTPADMDKLLKNDIIGNKLVHHALYYNLKNKTLYHQTAWPGKKRYLTPEPANSNWTLLNQKDTICYNECKVAYRVGKKNDTTMAWYVPSEKNGFGPSIYVGLPGVVLQVFDQLHGLIFTAIKIERTNQSLVSPLEHFKIKGYFIRKD